MVRANRYALAAAQHGKAAAEVPDLSGNWNIAPGGPSFDPADPTGAKVAEAPEEGDAVLTHTFDLEEVAHLRDNWFVFRDRRPDLYGALTSLDGGAGAER